jgi:hypothetical protein
MRYHWKRETKDQRERTISEKGPQNNQDQILGNTKENTMGRPYEIQYS